MQKRLHFLLRLIGNTIANHLAQRYHPLLLHGFQAGFLTSPVATAETVWVEPYTAKLHQ